MRSCADEDRRHRRPQRRRARRASVDRLSARPRRRRPRRRVSARRWSTTRRSARTSAGGSSPAGPTSRSSIGGGGSGEAIACNKLAGIRAVSADRSGSARSGAATTTRTSSCSARRSIDRLAREILEAWLATPFKGDQHARRLEMIARARARRVTARGTLGRGRAPSRRSAPSGGASQYSEPARHSRGSAPPRSRATRHFPGRRAPAARARTVPRHRRPGDGVALEEQLGHLADQGAVGDAVEAAYPPRSARRAEGVTQGPTRGSCANVCVTATPPARRPPAALPGRRTGVLGESLLLRQPIARAAGRRVEHHPLDALAATRPRTRAAHEQPMQPPSSCARSMPSSSSRPRPLRGVVGPGDCSTRPPERPDSRLSNAMHVKLRAEPLEQAEPRVDAEDRQFSIVALKPPGEKRSSGGPEPRTS